MERKLGLILGGSVMTGALLISGTAFAQSTTPAPAGGWQHGTGGMARRAPGVFGTVSAISGTTLTVTSKMPMRGGTTSTATPTTYTVDASNATVTKSGVASSVANIAVGDTVMVAGTVSGTSVTATIIRDGIMQGKGFGQGMGAGAGHVAGTATIQGNGQPVVGGTITAVSGTTLTITNKSNVTYTVNASSATIQKAGATSTVSSIAVGDNVVIQGTVNGSSVTASSVIDEGVPPTTSPTTNPPAGTNAGHGFLSGGFMSGIGSFFKHIFGFF